MKESLSFEVNAKPGDFIGNAKVVDIEVDRFAWESLSRQELEVLKPLRDAASLMHQAYAWQKTRYGAPTLAYLQALEEYVPESEMPEFHRFWDMMKHHAGQYDQNGKKFQPNKRLTSRMVPEEHLDRLVHHMGELLRWDNPKEIRELLPAIEEFVNSPTIQPVQPVMGGLLISNVEGLEGVVGVLAKLESTKISRSAVFDVLHRVVLHPRSFLYINGTNKLVIKAFPYWEFHAIRPLLEEIVEQIQEAREVGLDAPGLNEYLWAVQHDLFGGVVPIASDRALLDNDSRIQVTLRDVESYTDRLTGRQDYEGILSLVNEELTEKFKRIQRLAPVLEQALPCEDKYKHRAVQAGNVTLSEALYLAGAAVASSVTLAHSLPNPPLLQAIGTKKNMFMNLIKAKFEHILFPMMNIMYGHNVDEKPAWEAFLAHIIGHEISHGFIIHDGEALGSNYHSLEEAKADTISMYNFPSFAKFQGVHSAGLLKLAPKVYISHLIRSIRMHSEEAHSIGAKIQLNWLIQRGGIEHNGHSLEPTNGFYNALEALVKELCHIEGSGDRQRADGLVQNYGDMLSEVYSVIEAMESEGVPRDIVPVFPELP